MAPHIALVAQVQPGMLAESLVRGFEAAGARVSLIPYRNWLPALHSKRIRGLGAINRPLENLVRPAAEARLVATLTALQPTAILFLKCDDLHWATYAAIRQLTRVPMIAFHPDDPWNRGGRFSPGPAHRRALTQIRAVDIHLLWSRRLVDRARVEGARRAAFMPFGCDMSLHGPDRADGISAEGLAADVSFIGNWDAERERVLGPFAQAAADAGIEFALWGNAYWQSRCKAKALKAAWRGRPLMGGEMVQAVRSSAININVLRSQNKGAHNMRTFEIPCAGGFMLHERSRGLAGLFPPGEACEAFGDSAELLKKVQEILGDSDRRKEMAIAGHTRAVAEFTYTRWAEKVLALL